MILAIDIGNTETVIGLFEQGELLEHWRISTYPARTADELGLLLRALLRESSFDPDAVDAAALASVVPPVTRAFAAAATDHLGARVHMGEPTPVVAPERHDEAIDVRGADAVTLHELLADVERHDVAPAARIALARRAEDPVLAP